MDISPLNNNQNENNTCKFKTPKKDSLDYLNDNFQNCMKKAKNKNFHLNNKDLNSTSKERKNSVKNQEKNILNDDKKENCNKNFPSVPNSRNEIIKSKSFSNLNQDEVLNLREKNNGNDSYINAIIQCLLNIKKLTNYFLLNKENIKSQKINNKLSNSFLELIENLNKNKTSKELYYPKNFKNSLYKIQSKINSKDLFELIIEQLHSELTKNKNINQEFNVFIHHNLKNFPEYKNIFQSDNSSIISKLFYFMYNNQKKCEKCNTFVSKNEQISYLLVFPLEEMNEFKNNKNISICDCFTYYKKPNYIKNICDNCNSKVNFEKKNILLKGPEILIINITKGKSKGENILFNLEEKINISDFILYKEKQYNYELIGIMTSSGNDHYISFCKSVTNNIWYKYDNFSVNQCSFKDIKIKGTSDILFYSLVDN